MRAAPSGAAFYMLNGNLKEEMYNFSEIKNIFLTGY